MTFADYKLSCVITNQQENQILHIEVRNKLYPEECYSGHYAFHQLSQSITSLFRNLSHLYIYMNRPGCVYFDDFEAVLKICVLIAGEVREFAVNLEAKGREEGLKRKILTLSQQKARLQDQFQSLREQKSRKLEEVERDTNLQKQLIANLEREEEELDKIVMILEKEANDLQQECDLKMQLIRRQNRSVSENHSQNGTKVSNKSEIDIELIDDSACDKSSVMKSESNLKKSDSNYLRSESNYQKIDGSHHKAEPSNKKSKSWSVNFTLKEANELQSRKQFWIKQVSSLKKSKTLPLKKLINPDANFQAQTIAMINGIELKKMLFVEVFVNLQIIDLSQNLITQIEGLTYLRNLKKLILCQNSIKEIKGLANNHQLVEMNLARNQIEQLTNVFHLVNLKVLNLSKNKIREVPNLIYKLHNLVELHVDQNCIVKVSENVELLKHLQQFTLVGNRCYSDNNKSKQIIDRLINRGIRTVNPSMR